VNATTWVTVIAYDTPFLAQLATDHLDDAGIANRVLADSADGNLPHIAFGSGGYRVQVPASEEAVAREQLAALPEDALVGVDVGEFEDGQGVQPRTGVDSPLPGRGHSLSGRLIALIAIPLVLVVTIIFLWLSWPV
jgi:hypothetical protein